MKNHDYHFIITEGLKKHLNIISELGNYSFSGKINFILSKIDKIIRFTKVININEKSKVEYLDSHKHIHLYINKSLFKKVKYYHGKFNSYSIAVFVRMIIKVFLESVERYGYYGALKKIEKQKIFLKKINKLKNNRLKIIQLLCLLEIKINKNIKLSIILEKLLL